MNNKEILRARIARAFASSMDLSEVAEDIAFHMTDWDHDVDGLIRLYDQPEAFSDDEIVTWLRSS